MDSDDDVSPCIIQCPGAALSTVGYALMLITAALFPAWRRCRVNQLWLHMCGCKLLFMYCETLFELWVFSVPHPPWLDTRRGRRLHIIFTYEYLVLATCNWVAAGAWLAYRQLVIAKPDAVHAHYMKLAALFAYVAPLPIFGAVELLRGYVTCYVYGALVPTAVVLAVVCSVCLYARALCAVCSSGRAFGRRPDILANTVLTIMFALTSGFQYILLVVNLYLLKVSKYNNTLDSLISNEVLIISWKLHVIIIYYNVVMYAILLVVGVKQTRRLWVEFWKKIFHSCLPGYCLNSLVGSSVTNRV